MKRKLVRNVHMREVENFDWLFEKNHELNAYVAIKKINKVSQPAFKYTNGSLVPYVQEGSFLVEYTPLDEFYNVRVFINPDKEILGYYIDIVKESGLDPDDVPYYLDLYLDIIYSCPASTNGVYFIQLDDEDEIKEALNLQHITQEDYDMAYEVATKVMNELKENSNRFVNRGIRDLERMLQKSVKRQD